MNAIAKGNRRGTKARPSIMALEPRLMFDGAAVAEAAHVAADAADKSVPVALAAPVDSGKSSVADVLAKADTDNRAAAITVVRDATPAPDNSGGRHEVVVVDTTVADWQTLVAGMDPSIPMILLRPNADGMGELEVLADALSDFHDLDAIHLVAEGRTGAILLAGEVIYGGDLDAASPYLSRIGAALKPGGDFMLYSCSVAGSDGGKAFIDGFSRALGDVDVAASTDRTGPTRLGGDWDLEYKTGDIETVLPFTLAGMQDISHCLGCHGGPAWILHGVNYASVYRDGTNEKLIYFNSQAITWYAATTVTYATGNPSNPQYTVSAGAALSPYGTTESWIAGGLIDCIDAGPTTTISTAALSADTGSNGTDWVTKTASQTISGTLSANLGAGEKVQVSYDNGATWSDATSYTQGSSSWSTTTTLSGANTFQARVSDGSKNGTAYSHSYSLDTTAPVISSASVPATTMKVGDTVTVSLVVSDDGGTAYTLGSSSVDGFALSNLTRVNSTHYTARFTVTEGGTDVAAGSDIPLSIVLTDSAGNSNAAYTTAISQAGDAIDAHKPVVTAVSVPATSMKVGDTVTATITVSSDADTLSLTSGTIGGFALSNLQKVNATTYTAQFTVTNGGTDVAAGADIPVNLVLHDSAGNASTAFTTAISQAGDAIDANRPVVSAVSVPASTMKIGDTVTATITVSNDGGDTYTLGTSSIDGFALSNLQRINATTYTAQFTVTSGGTDVAAASNIPVSIVLNDSAGNASTAFTTAISQAGDAIDANRPVVSNVTLNAATYKVGATITATITVDSDADTGYTINTATIGGHTFGNLTRVNATTWTATYTVQNGDTDVFAGNPAVNIVLADGAGNQSTAYTTAIAAATTIDGHAPTDIGLSAATSALAAGSTIGTLSATDTNSGSETFTYSLPNGVGHNNSFAIAGSTLTVGGGAITAGTYNVTVRVTDAGGNTFDKQFTITAVNTPAVTSINRAGAQDTKGTGGLDYTVTFNQTVDGVDASDFSVVKGAGVTGTAVVTVTAGSDGSNSYTVHVAGLAGDGTVELDLNATGTGIVAHSDGTTAILTGSTGGQTYTLDNTAPSAPSGLTVSDDNGTSATDGLTNDTTLVISGTAEANSTVEVFKDGVSIGTTTTNGSGAWSYDYTGTTLAEGTYAFTAKATDAAGNVSAASIAKSVTIDTTAPGAVSGTLGILENSANGTAVGSVTASGAVGFSLVGNAGGRFAINPATGEVTVANGSLLDFETNTSHTITVRAVDAAGNTTDTVVTVSVTDSINENAPALDLNGAAAGTGNTVTLAAAANGLATGTATAADADNTWNGTTLTVQRVTTGGAADGNLNDIFNFGSGVVSNRTITRGQEVTDGTLSIGGTQIATWTYASATGRLIVTFNANAAAGDMQNVVRSIGYANATPYGNATVRFSVNDGLFTANADVSVTSSTIYVDQTTYDTDGDGKDGFNLAEALAKAADGDTILIKDGTYRGQFRASTGVTIDAASGANGHVTIEAPDTANLVASSENSMSGRLRYAILDLRTATPGQGAVTVRNITVDGRYQAVRDDNNGNDDLIGIAAFNTNATISHVVVQNIASSLDNLPGSNANQWGFSENFGIVAEAQANSPVTVTIENSTIREFQKTGIIAWGAGLTTVIRDNSIVMAGTRGVSNQNGMQVGSAGTRAGVRATITGNTITNVGSNDSFWSATGILLRQTGVSEVAHNSILSTGVPSFGGATTAIGLSEITSTISVHDNDLGNTAQGIVAESPYGGPYNGAHTISGNDASRTAVAVYDSHTPSNTAPEAANQETITVNSTAANNGRGLVEYQLRAGDDRFTDTGVANTSVNGGAGDDVLITGSGDDILEGGDGADRMTGGAGADTFVIGNSDTITDMTAIVDRMQVKGAVVPKSRMTVTTSGADAILAIDTDGVNGADITVTLVGKAGLTLADLAVKNIGTDTFIRIDKVPQASVTPLSPPAGQVGSAYSFSLPNGTFTDADVGDTLTYSAAGLPRGLSIDSQTGAITGTPAAPGSSTVTITVTDGAGESVTKTLTISVNDATVAPPPPSNPVFEAPKQTVPAENGPAAPLVTTVREPTVTDKPAGMETVVRTVPLTANDAATGNFHLGGPVSSIGSATSSDRAGGVGGGLASLGDARTTGGGTFQVALAGRAPGGGDALVVNTRVPDAAFDAGSRISVTVPGDAFAHTRADATVTLTATRGDGAALPGWMSFNPRTGTFEGTPPPNFRGEVVVKVTARDNDGRQVVQTFKIVVGRGQGNLAPTQGDGRGDGESQGQGRPQGSPGRTGDAGHDGKQLAKVAGRSGLTQQLRELSQEGRVAKQAAFLSALKRGDKVA